MVKIRNGGFVNKVTKKCWPLIIQVLAQHYSHVGNPMGSQNLVFTAFPFTCIINFNKISPKIILVICIHFIAGDLAIQ